MKITVRIADVEVVVDRPNFRETETAAGDKFAMDDVILPTVESATAKAKELYEQRQQHI